MKLDSQKLWFSVAMLGVLCSACSTDHKAAVHHPGAAMAIKDAPPPPKEDVLMASPGNPVVWTPAFWVYGNGQWVYVPGHWQGKPWPSAVWVQGSWDHPDDTWEWTPGEWQ